MHLRDGAIYQLPNGRELIARVSAGEETRLCSINSAEDVQYEVSSEGRLFAHGRLTAWSTEDLSDTSRVFSPEAPAQVFDRIP